MKDDLIYYSVGPLLYCPANKESIVGSLVNEKFGKCYSLALCLEDTINDNFVAEAEATLITSIKAIYDNHKQKDFYLPKIFVRVRSAEQILRLFKLFEEAADIVTGVIVPKFSLENCDEYIAAVKKLNKISKTTKYVMPIYESMAIVDKRIRIGTLYAIKDKLAEIEDKVLNIRVGGNDLCHIFGFRRDMDESIHSIKPISDIFTDIISVYGPDYVVSGPVWEYFAGEGWDEGLKAEIREDKLCGFTGKTVIHPNQIPVVVNAYKVPKAMYEDALAILNWDENNPNLVIKDINSERMNEYKTHFKWAKKIVYLAQFYGTK